MFGPQIACLFVCRSGRSLPALRIGNTGTTVIIKTLDILSAQTYLVGARIHINTIYSVQRVLEPDPLLGISFDTQPDSVLEIIR